jgi:hypothetical protein
MFRKPSKLTDERRKWRACGFGNFILHMKN